MKTIEEQAEWENQVSNMIWYLKGTPPESPEQRLDELHELANMLRQASQYLEHGVVADRDRLVKFLHEAEAKAFKLGVR